MWERDKWIPIPSLDLEDSQNPMLRANANAMGYPSKVLIRWLSYEGRDWFLILLKGEQRLGFRFVRSDSLSSNSSIPSRKRYPKNKIAPLIYSFFKTEFSAIS